MAETTPLDVPVVPEQKTNRIQRFRINHPRTAKVVGIAAVTAAVLGTVTVLKNRKQAALDSETETDELDTSS